MSSVNSTLQIAHAQDTLQVAHVQEINTQQTARPKKTALPPDAEPAVRRLIAEERSAAPSTNQRPSPSVEYTAHPAYAQFFKLIMYDAYIVRNQSLRRSQLHLDAWDKIRTLTEQRPPQCQNFDPQNHIGQLCKNHKSNCHLPLNARTLSKTCAVAFKQKQNMKLCVLSKTCTVAGPQAAEHTMKSRNKANQLWLAISAIQTQNTSA